MEKFGVWKVKAACGGRTIYVDVRLGLTPTIALVVALMPCPHGLRIICPDLLHSRITIAESMDDQSRANRAPVLIY
jgi:hypothetical protein